ncbi:hypothetical protein Tco_1119955 [Tanacetum coccineum]
MYYPRFTKVIVDYFMAKDRAIPKRNKMFWHYARDDFMFTTVRVISNNQDTQVYGAILPQHLTNQAMLESKAYMTYRAYATGEKTPKPKSTKKKFDFESSPKMKPTQAFKGKIIKTLAKGDKAAKMKQSATKSKGLTVLSGVALSEADQMKLATKRRKKEFHSSHASGLGDGVDIQSKVPDEQQHTISGTNEGVGEDEEENDKHDSANDNDDEDDDQENDIGETESDDDGDNFVHPNLSTYKADDLEKEKEKENDDDEVSSDQKVSTPPNYEILDEEENQEDDDNVMGGEQEDVEDKELYRDLNLNLDKRDAEMKYAQTNQEMDEVHVTLTTEPPVVQQQSSSVSSDLVSKFINPSSDTETELSELKQTNQFAEALSSIPGIVANYLASKMKDAVNVVVHLQSNKLREEAQAENDEFLK